MIREIVLHAGVVGERRVMDGSTVGKNSRSYDPQREEQKHAHVASAALVY